LPKNQADLKGQMRWDEVKEINFVRRTSGKQFFFGGLGGHGIVLKVAGAMIVIPDVYDRPLPLIHQLLLYYWEDRTAEERHRVWHFDAERLEETLQDDPRRSGGGDTGITSERQR
jgi:hypothetical protein